MGNGLRFFIPNRLAGFDVPQGPFTVQKITFAWGETACVKDASVTSNAVSIKIDLPAQTLTMKGDRFLLHQAVGNLVKNAIEHAHPQTEITVSARAEDKSLQITVSNIGEPIPDYAIDKLFDRFYSLPNRKGQKGSGIGLSFVREVAKLHGGQIQITNASSNNVQAQLRLPSN